MRKAILILTSLLITSLGVTQAQNVFKKYGFKKEVLTLSKGKYQEVFKNEDVVQIGTVLLNTKTNKVVKLLNEDTTKTTYNAELSSRFLTIDPLAEKYYNISPYVFCKNNPIKYVDLDGRDAIYIAYPKYKANGIPFTGHAGVLLIDNKTGYTKYYEYGRYDKENKGLVRTVAVSNVVIGKDGKPTTESLNKVMTQLSDKAGHGGDIEGAYIISDKFKEMNDYAKSKMDENNNPNREEYSITSNNCGTFAEDVITQDKSVDQPTIIIPSPINIVDEYQEEGNARVQYNAKTKTTTIGAGNEEDAKVKVKDN